jgi:hypothetical protein
MFERGGAQSKVGIGIQKTNAGIGISALAISVQYRAKK